MWLLQNVSFYVQKKINWIFINGMTNERCYYFFYLDQCFLQKFQKMWTFRRTHFQTFFIFSQSLSYREFPYFFSRNFVQILSYLAAVNQAMSTTSLAFYVRICWDFLYKRHTYLPPNRLEGLEITAKTGKINICIIRKIHRGKDKRNGKAFK